MIEDIDPAVVAAEALIALGWPVEPHGLDMEAWVLGCLIWTDADLMALAVRQGIVVAGGPVQ